MVGLWPITIDVGRVRGDLADQVERRLGTRGVQAGVEVGLGLPARPPRRRPPRSRGCGRRSRPARGRARSRGRRASGRRLPRRSRPFGSRVRPWSESPQDSALAVAHDHQPAGGRRLGGWRLVHGHTVAADSLPVMPSGPLMIIGGAEDKLRKRTILKEFVVASGGRRRPHRRHPHRLVPRPGDRRGLRGAVHQARRRARDVPPGRRAARTRTTPTSSRPSTGRPASS